MSEQPKDPMGEEEQKVPTMEELVHQAVVNIQLYRQKCKGLALRDWITGATFDYSVSPHGTPSIRTKQGIMVDDYLPGKQTIR